MDGSGTTNPGVSDVIEHFGVKGMKWGVRRTDAQLAKGKTPKSEKLTKVKDARGDQLTKGDVKWNRSTMSTKKGIQAYNKSAKEMNDTHIARINNKPEYKDKNFNDPKNSKLRDKYYKEYTDTFEKSFNKNLTEAFGESPTGKFVVRSAGDNSPRWYVGFKDEASHAADDMVLEITYDANGQIVKFAPGGTLEQSDMSPGSDVLEHFGVKGMKWGVRRTAAQLAKASGSAKEAAGSAKAVAGRKSSIKKLSDEELNKRLKRKENESKLNNLEKSEGEKLATEILGGIGKKAAKHIGTGVAIYAGKMIVNQLLGNGAASFIPKPKK